MLVVVTLLGLWLVGGLQADTPAALTPVTQVILIRHAEKAAEPKNDPVLSPAGEARVKLLGEMLAEVPLTHVFASEYQRTQLTVRPLAETRGLTVTVVPAKEPAELAARLRALAGGVALVAGHSNTLGPILEALGAPAIAEIPDTDYDNFFVVTLAPQAPPTVLRLRYRPAEH